MPARFTLIPALLGPSPPPPPPPPPRLRTCVIPRTSSRAISALSSHHFEWSRGPETLGGAVEHWGFGVEQLLRWGREQPEGSVAPRVSESSRPPGPSGDTKLRDAEAALKSLQRVRHLIPLSRMFQRPASGRRSGLRWSGCSRSELADPACWGLHPRGVQDPSLEPFLADGLALDAGL